MASCRACGQPILFALVGNKTGRPPSRMPLNPRPDPAGNVAVSKDVTGTLIGRVLGKAGQALGWERVHMPHFATCPEREQRKPAPAPAGVTSLDAYRKRAQLRAAGKAT